MQNLVWIVSSTKVIQPFWLVSPMLVHSVVRDSVKIAGLDPILGLCPCRILLQKKVEYKGWLKHVMDLCRENTVAWCTTGITQLPEPGGRRILTLMSLKKTSHNCFYDIWSNINLNFYAITYKDWLRFFTHWYTLQVWWHHQCRILKVTRSALSAFVTKLMFLARWS